MHFLRGTQAEADAGMVLIAGVILICFVVLVACAATGVPLGVGQ